MMTKSIVRSALLLIPLVASAFAGEVIKIDIWDQRVAIVNTEAICKRDVEERMGGIAEKLWAFKKDRQASKMWTPNDEIEWNKLYVEAFRDALRRIVRERLMLQHYAIEKMTLDEKNVQKRQSNHMKMLREAGVKNIDVADVTKRIKEMMMLEEFRGKFDNAMEYPKKPEVEKYYADNIDKYQRKAGSKIRVIRIDGAYIDKVTGAKIVRDNPYGMLEDIRRDIVSFGANFAEIAKTRNDDSDLRETAGLIYGPNKDPYIVPEDYNKTLSNATRNLKIGEVSPIFAYGNNYAIAMVEDRRETGPEPLEGKTYDKIFDEMYQSKKLRKEDEWFRKTLSKTLVMQIKEGNATPIDISFFFPDDIKKPDFINNTATPTPADKKAKESKDKEKDPK